MSVVAGGYGCGNSGNGNGSGRDEDATLNGLQLIPVSGKAQFGSQCPYGTFSQMQDAPLELVDCPVQLGSVQLNELLEPIVFQADCKKKVLDVRNGPGRSGKATTWELMPDGSFTFVMEAGSAKLKQDGAGTADCSTPLTAQIWGKVDCPEDLNSPNLDKVTIRVETLWWLGKTVADITGISPHTSPAATGTPVPYPYSTGTSTPIPSRSHSPTPSPSPFVSPSVRPSPLPTSTGTPTMTPSGRPIRFGLAADSDPQPTATPSTAPSGPQEPTCKLPAPEINNGCYFHNISHINQCS